MVLKKKIGSITNFVAEYLRKSNNQRLLGLIATLYSIPITKQIIRIQYDENIWTHRHNDGVIFDRKINYEHSLPKFESMTIDTYEYLYKPKYGDVVFDIGAGIGTETYHFSKAVGQKGKVISIEAHPHTYLCLNKFCKHNKLTNVILFNLAISNNETEVLISNNEKHISSTIINTKKGRKVKSITLDSLMKQLNILNIEFLKMNIEGAEKKAIEGMSESIKKTKFVCISCHDHRADLEGLEEMRTKELVKNFLKKNNFKIINRDSDNRAWIRDQINGINRKYL